MQPGPTEFLRTDSLDDLAHLNHQAAVAAGGAMGPPKQAAVAAGGALTEAEKTLQEKSFNPLDIARGKEANKRLNESTNKCLRAYGSIQ